MEEQNQKIDHTVGKDTDKKCQTSKLIFGVIGVVLIILGTVGIGLGVHFSSSESAKDPQSPNYPITPPQGKLCYII